MRLGIGSYTYTWAVGVPEHMPERPLTPLALLQRAHCLGVSVVQFCDNLPLAGLGKRELDEVCDFALAHQLAIELGTRGIRDVDNLRRHLELALKVGSPFVRVVVDAKEYEPSPGATVDGLQKVLPEFVSAGVKIAIENHDRFSCSTLTRIVEQLGPDKVGICLDTANSFGALEGPEVVVNMLAPYTLNLHIKDFTIARVSSQMGYVISGAPAGQGRLNLPWLVRTLGGTARNISAIIELWTPFGPDLEGTIARENDWAEQSVRHLRSLLSEEDK